MDINLIIEVFFAFTSHPIRRKNLNILRKNFLKALVHAFMRRRDYQVDVSLEYFLEFMMASGTAHQIHCVKPEILHYKRISFPLLFMKVTLGLLVE
jgi:hypothetical protein